MTQDVRTIAATIVGDGAWTDEDAERVATAYLALERVLTHIATVEASAGHLRDVARVALGAQP